MLKLIILSIFFIKTNGWDLGKPYPKSRKGQKDWLCDLMKFLISHANHSTPCFTHQISMHGPPDTHVPKIPPFSLYSKATTVREFRLHFFSHFSHFLSKTHLQARTRDLAKRKFLNFFLRNFKVNSSIHLIFYYISRWIHIMLFIIICDDHP